MGFNCGNGNSKEMADRIVQLVENQKLRENMGRNSRRCAEEKFDRKNSYVELKKVIL